MSADVYTRLREFMDKLPAGYPETPTGVEIKILKKLFTPDEAELTMKLNSEPEEVAAIAARIGMDEKELGAKLEEMAQKGLIYRVRSGDKRQSVLPGVPVHCRGIRVSTEPPRQGVLRAL
jgi:DNA-binding MarR family transcriptional regulator